MADAKPVLLTHVLKSLRTFVQLIYVPPTRDGCPTDHAKSADRTRERTKVRKHAQPTSAPTLKSSKRMGDARHVLLSQEHNKMGNVLQISVTNGKGCNMMVLVKIVKTIQEQVRTEDNALNRFVRLHKYLQQMVYAKTANPLLDHCLVERPVALMLAAADKD